MRKNIILLFFVSLFALSNVQAQSNGTIINTYTEVTSVVNCNSISVSSIKGVGASDKFAISDKVLIIQMKGASVNLSNDNNFGKVLSYNNAGLYEELEIQSISGNIITFSSGLKNKYDIQGVVQLIRIPQYDILEVTSNLIPFAWNGTVGGILVIHANEINLHANLSANGMGFRGGQVTNNTHYNCAQTDYYYSQLDSDRGALKGEGIADVKTGYERGKGSWTTGGGGGNSTNAGGGGGGNGGSGGFGGKQYNGAGDCQPNDLMRGIGGQSIDPTLTSRLFLGGGGGAGQENDSNGTSGANGGGIIILVTNSITGNGYSINANGNNADNTFDAGRDAAGGGGAGGSILLKISQFNGNLAISSNGGNGGNVIFYVEHGPGGGGGGGQILSTFSIPNTVQRSIQGGKNGVINTGMPYGATSGESGINNLIYESNTNGLAIAGPDRICNNQIATYKVTPACSGCIWEIIQGNATIISQTSNSAEVKFTNSDVLIKVGQSVCGSITKFVKTTDPSQFNLTSDKDSICTSTEVILSIQAQEDLINTSWYIQDNSLTDNKINAGSSTISVYPLQSPETIYFVTALTKDNCVLKDTVHIKVTDKQDLFVPNLITLNNDKRNDVFFIYNKNTATSMLENSELEIYNRWGELIYLNKSYDNTWPQQTIIDGLYFYRLIPSCADINEYKGWVQVIKGNE